MKFKEYKQSVQKVGYLLSDVTTVESGVSQKTGKPYSGFSYLWFLPYGAHESVQVFIDANFVDEVTAAVDTLEYLQAVVITGEATANGRFSATEIAEFDFNKAQ